MKRRAAGFTLLEMILAVGLMTLVLASTMFFYSNTLKSRSEGEKLAQRCQEILQQAELKITTLQEEFASLSEEPEPYPLGEEEEMPPK